MGPPFLTNSYDFYQFCKTGNLIISDQKLLLFWGDKKMTLLLLKIIFSSHQNKLSNVLITDNEIIGFDELVEVVAINF